MPSAHADVMDAAAYWRQFVTAFYFDHPDDTIAGALVAYDVDGPTKDPTPRLTLQTKEGDRYTVLASQERLKGALKKACPAIGDRLKITYTGDAPKTAPGMTPAKLFTVEVRRANPPPPVPIVTTPRGLAATNGQGAGS